MEVCTLEVNYDIFSSLILHILLYTYFKNITLYITYIDNILYYIYIYITEVTCDVCLKRK